MRKCLFQKLGTITEVTDSLTPIKKIPRQVHSQSNHSIVFPQISNTMQNIPNSWLPSNAAKSSTKAVSYLGGRYSFCHRTFWPRLHVEKGGSGMSAVIWLTRQSLVWAPMPQHLAITSWVNKPSTMLGFEPCSREMYLQEGLKIIGP